jgi:hypothetical protein
VARANAAAQDSVLTEMITTTSELSDHGVNGQFDAAYFTSSHDVVNSLLLQLNRFG